MQDEWHADSKGCPAYLNFYTLYTRAERNTDTHTRIHIYARGYIETCKRNRQVSYAHRISHDALHGAVPLVQSSSPQSNRPTWHTHFLPDWKADR